MEKNEVPQVGDFSKWSQSKRDEWIELKAGCRATGLPCETIRHRAGQPEMQFCTFSK